MPYMVDADVVFCCPHVAYLFVGIEELELRIPDAEADLISEALG